MSDKCPYCKSTNIEHSYAKKVTGSLLDLGVAFLKSFITGNPYHTPTTHFGDASEVKCRCKNCGRVFYK